MGPKSRGSGRSRGRGSGRGRGGRGGKRSIPGWSTVSIDPLSLSAINPGAAAGEAEAAEEANPSNNDTQQSSTIAKLAKMHWAQVSNPTEPPTYQAALIDTVMCSHIIGTNYSRASLQALERHQYLEQYLWPHFHAKASDTHVMSILLMVNEKQQSGGRALMDSAWEMMAEGVGMLVERVVDLTTDRVVRGGGGLPGDPVGGLDMWSARNVLVQFLTGCFGSLQADNVRSACLPLVSVGVWRHVQGQALLEAELEAVPQLRRLWKHAGKRISRDCGDKRGARRNADFLALLVADFIGSLFPAEPATTAAEGTDNDEPALAYACGFVALLVLLESQLATRRFVNLLLMDTHVVELCRQSPWLRRTGHLARRFGELVERLDALVHFQVATVQGRALSDVEARDGWYASVEALQLAAFRLFPQKLQDLAVAAASQVAGQAVAEHLAPLDDAELGRMAEAVGMRRRVLDGAAAAAAAAGVGGRLPAEIVVADGAGAGAYTRDFLLRCFAERFRRRPTAGERVSGVSAYPTEQQLFSGVLADAEHYGQPRNAPAARGICYPVLSVPRLGLQFLTLQDYLQRNHELLRWEAAADVREAVVDAARRLRPLAEGGFGGWARMALPLSGVTVVEVVPPRVGEDGVPTRVVAEITVDLSAYTESVRAEWDAGVRPRDTLLLVELRAGSGSAGAGSGSAGAGSGSAGAGSGNAGAGSGNAGAGSESVGVVRGCQVDCILDARGRAANGAAAAGGAVRRFRVLLDAHQYAADAAAGHAAVYADGRLTAVVRRRAQDGGVGAAAAAVRDMMMRPPELPAWLAPTLLGYGDPAAAAAMNTKGAGTVFFGDTFVSEEHLRQALGRRYPRIEVVGRFGAPCEADFPETPDGAVRVRSRAAEPLLLGSGRNPIAFTAAQVEAIQSAAQPGLTLVVGPPGTGKTDVAVQAVANLYHAHPRETILLLTHSNQALNQLFAKIVGLDIEPRHLLRLGHGEEALAADESFSKAGRVESFLERRQELLGLVAQLAADMGAGGGDFGYTCETARMFFATHVRVRWESFRRKHLATGNAQDIADAFPFAAFCGRLLGQPLFAHAGALAADGAVGAAEAGFGRIQRIFDELRDIQPFELLSTPQQRTDYLLTNQARIIAMTCTHAALRRTTLASLRIRIDTVVMEEAAQVLDIETLIPLTLSRNLRRLIMIGDHNQLPPVVRSRGLALYANMEQSLFTRLVRLGVPYVELDRQARCRPEIASLYRFRYRDLKDLAPQTSEGAFARPNLGFANAFQFIDTPDFRNQGETQPTAHYFQNLGEAEYCVLAFQYMRLLGYPLGSIAILTTYQGQRALIRDVLQRRCAWLPYFGSPRVCTVDQFQGEQADFVLLSLVRTRSIGYLRDLRRMTVALSRARLGLYVFGRRSVLDSCFEMKRIVQGLVGNGEKLKLRVGEEREQQRCGEEQREAVDGRGKEVVVEGVEHMAKIVYEMIERHVENESQDDDNVDDNVDVDVDDNVNVDVDVDDNVNDVEDDEDADEDAEMASDDNNANTN